MYWYIRLAGTVHENCEYSVRLALTLLLCCLVIVITSIRFFLHKLKMNELPIRRNPTAIDEPVKRHVVHYQYHYIMGLIVLIYLLTIFLKVLIQSMIRISYSILSIFYHPFHIGKIFTFFYSISQIIGS